MFLGINRAIGPNRGRHGSDKCRHEGSRKKSHGNGKMLWPLRAALPEVYFYFFFFFFIYNFYLNIQNIYYTYVHDHLFTCIVITEHRYNFSMH